MQLQPGLAKRLCVLFLIFCTVAWSSAARSAAPSRKDYVIGMNFTSLAGVASSQWYELADSVLDSINKEYGYNTKLEKFSAREEVVKAFLDGDIDGMQMWVDHAMEIEAAGGAYWPLVTFTIDGIPWNSYCIWQKKEKVVKSVAEVQGKSLMLYPRTKSILTLRQFLFDNGIDKPLWEVFKTFEKTASPNTGLMATAMGKADVYWEDGDNYRVLDLINPSLKTKLARGICTDPVYARPLIALNKKTVNESDYKEIKGKIEKSLDDFTKMAKKYPRLQAAKRMKDLLKVEIAVVGGGYFDTDIKLYNNAHKRFWFAEAEYIISELEKADPGTPVAIKPLK